MTPHLVPTFLVLAGLAIISGAVMNYRLAYSDRARVAEYLRAHQSEMVERWIPTTGPLRVILTRLADPFPECHLPMLVLRRGIFPKMGEVADSWARVRIAVLVTSLAPLVAAVLFVAAVWLWL